MAKGAALMNEVAGQVARRPPGRLWNRVQGVYRRLLGLATGNGGMAATVEKAAGRTARRCGRGRGATAVDEATGQPVTVVEEA